MRADCEMERSMSQKQGCTQKRVEVSQEDLPLCCPLPQLRLWDAHPRVYLPIERMGHLVCPYCDTEYKLIDFNQTN